MRKRILWSLLVIVVFFVGWWMVQNLFVAFVFASMVAWWPAIRRREAWRNAHTIFIERRK